MLVSLVPGSSPPFFVTAIDLPKPTVEYWANDGLDPPQRVTGGSSCDLPSSSDEVRRDATLHWGWMHQLKLLD